MKKFRIQLVYFIIFFGISISFTNCSDDGDDEPPVREKYDLSVTISPNGSGTVSPSSGSYTEGTSVKLTGTPSTNYKFKEWKGDVTGTTNPITVKMNSNKSISIVFELMDSDGDGVTDDKDKCSDTPSGETVDENGCSDSQLTYVPDDNFENRLISLGYDDVLDNKVITQNIRGIVSLDVQRRDVTDLTGIEDFISLTHLICGGNSINSLDTSENLELKVLLCNNNNLSNLNVTKNSKLDTLSMSDNQISNIDLTKNINLSHLEISLNKISKIDLSSNIKLKKLYFDENPIEEIDLTNNTELTLLLLNNVSIMNIDISNNQLLKTIGFQSTPMTSIDLSNNTLVEHLNIGHHKFSKIDLSKNINLKELDVQDGKLSQLDVSNNSNLIYLDTRMNSELNCIRVNNNQLENIPENWTKDDTCEWLLNCN